ncbi:MAG: hypothetical protein ACI3XI_04745 [Eubacteriales bacterium]
MKKTIALIIALIMSLSLLGAVSVSAEGLTGAGTEADPYKISTAADLDAFKAMSGNFTSDMHFVLTNDIDYTDYKVGDAAPEKTWAGPEKFAGTFDGQGYTISGLYFSDATKDIAGFIASTTDATENTAPVVIKNLNIADSYFEAKTKIGSVLGTTANTGASDVTVSGCSSSAVIKAPSGTTYAGGIVGYSQNVAVIFTIENCLFTGSVEGGACLGGICGQIGRSKAIADEKPSYVKNCLNLGTVNGSRIVAGIVGRDYAVCVVTDCVNVGTVTANTDDTRYPSQFGSIVAFDTSANSGSYYLASNPAKQITQEGAVSCSDSKHNAVDSFTAATCPTLSADFWVFNADGTIMLKTFAAGSGNEDGTDVTTEEPPVTTEAPAQTTEAPAQTTEAPVQTTEPAESGDTGDTSWIFIAFAAVSVIGVAVVAKKKEN